MKMFLPDFLKEQINKLIVVEVFDYYDGPRFYSCRDKAGQLYVAYWVEQNGISDSWLYLKISQDRYFALKNGSMSVAEVLSLPEEGFVYFVTTGEDGTLRMFDQNMINEDWLPDSGYKLNMSVQSLPEKTSSAKLFAESTMRQVLDLAFEKTSNSFEIGCGKLGKLLDSTQNILYALASDQQSDVRKVPEVVKYNSEFLVTGVFASSFGVRLQSKSNDLFSNDNVADAAETLALLLTNSSVPEVLTANLRKFNILTRSRFKHLVKVVVDSEVSIKTDWGSPSGKTITSTTSYYDFVRVLDALDRADEATTQRTEKAGKLVGVDVESDFFAIMLEDREVIKGRLAKHLEGRHFEVPSRVIASLEETCTIDPLTDKEKWSYMLNDIRLST